MRFQCLSPKGHQKQFCDYKIINCANWLEWRPERAQLNFGTQQHCSETFLKTTFTAKSMRLRPSIPVAVTSEWQCSFEDSTANAAIRKIQTLLWSTYL